MPDIAKPQAGTFCWIELQTSDPGAARKFYSQLLGWNVVDMPPSGGPPYAMATLGEGRNVAGLMQLPEAAARMGAPPHWGAYIAVDDVKATTEAAARRGGKGLVPPSAMGPGTFSVIQDPTGGVFQLWHSKEPMGAFVVYEPGAFAWAELMSTNADVARGFYTSVFGWTPGKGPVAGMDYTVFKLGETSVGGLMQMPDQMKGAPSHWAVYFAVADCDGAVSRAVSMRARVLAPAMDIPTVGRFAVLADPQGVSFSVIQFPKP